MKKRILSFVVILCTTICVGIMIYSSRIDVNENSIKGKVEVMNTNNKTNSAESKIQNDKNKGKSEEKSKDNITNSPQSKSKELISMTDSYKKNKMDMIADKIDEDKKEIFSQYDEKVDKENQRTKSNNDDKNNDNLNSEKDLPVFKVSRSKIKDSLTIADKEKLLSVGSKLSAVDYEKVNQYLKNGSDEDIKNTIKLLKQRLSDKDYGKVEQVVKKFINMESVNR
ncbi:hypothetical protein HBE96_02245 [Clostridium sp. P21]|uniref:Uncharacterized protein n=1 Tax=Clostridium muellerianum TaxID=2716538 RepID=A0A7Y0HME4_9CLOT|nr:hypothetical protein [Clostridium muellerianum]NMM61532.1 hypothetical protein [Clostridium muellerianum]